MGIAQRAEGGFRFRPAQPMRLDLRLQTGEFRTDRMERLLPGGKFRTDACELPRQVAEFPGGDPQVEAAKLVLQRLVSFRLAHLPIEAAQLTLHLVQDILHPRQVRPGILHLPLRLLLPDAELGHTRRLLDDHPLLFGPGVDDRQDLALLDDGVSAGSRAGVEEELGDVLEPAGDLVDEELALAVAESPAGHLDLGIRFVPRGGRAVVVSEGEGNFGHSQRPGGVGPGEDDVLKRLAAEIGRSVLPQHPADRVHDVGLPAPVGADNRCNPVGKFENRLVVEGFKTEKFEFF